VPNEENFYSFLGKEKYLRPLFENGKEHLRAKNYPKELSLKRKRQEK